MWLNRDLPRTDRIVLEAYRGHWNVERGPRLERVVFRNDIEHSRALELVCTTEGEVDIVTEVAPGDGRRVIESEHAELVRVDAMRVISGIINRGSDAPLDDVRARRALNLAIDRDRLVEEGFAGYAQKLAGLTPPHAAGVPEGQEPYPHDPDEARRLLGESGWPEGRALRLATSVELEGPSGMVAEDLREALGVEVGVTVIGEDDLLGAAHVLVEKRIALTFDVLVHSWFDLASDAPPAVLHREYFHSTGAFRAGPVLPEVEALFARFITRTDPAELVQASADIDRFAYDEALSVFLCAPQALYAVNRHVSFKGYAATFELADTEVSEQHWSRRG